MFLEKIKNSQKLEQILLNFVDVLRINILIVDSQGSPVLVPKTNGYGFSGACKWGILQYLGSSEFLSQFHQEGSYLKSVDAFGFQNFAISLDFNSIGYLIVGPVILNKQLDQPKYKGIAEELGVNFADFLGYLSEIRVVSFNSLKSTLNLLFELSQYALKISNGQTQEKHIKPDHSIFTTLLDLAMALTQAECGSIMLFDKETQELTIQVQRGLNPQKFQNVRVKLGEGIAGLAAQEKTSFVINEGRSSNRIKHLLKKPELKCSVIIPIVKNSKEVIGVMNIATHHSNSRLATHSQQILESLTKITSSTLSEDL